MVVLKSRNEISKVFKMNFQQGLDILKMAYQDDQRGMAKLLKGYSELKNKKNLTLYHFLKSIVDVEMNYKELNMMKNLIELHTIKSNPINPADE